MACLNGQNQARLDELEALQNRLAEKEKVNKKELLADNADVECLRKKKEDLAAQLVELKAEEARRLKLEEEERNRLAELERQRIAAEIERQEQERLCQEQERLRIAEEARVEDERVRRDREVLATAIAAGDVNLLASLIRQHDVDSKCSDLVASAKEIVARDAVIQEQRANERRKAKQLLELTGEDWKTLSGLARMREGLKNVENAVRFADFDASRWEKMVTVGDARMRHIVADLDRFTAKAADLVKTKSEDLEALTLCKDNMNRCVSNAYSSELDQLYAGKLAEADAIRKKLHNRLQTVRGATRVFARLRPLFEDEYEVCSKITLLDVSVFDPNSSQAERSFQFDAVFNSENDHSAVFMDCEDLVMSVVDGYNATVFAYGQTGSGKTYTMFGTGNDTGIVNRSVDALFSTIAHHSNYIEASVSVTMVELYNNKVVDLLNPTSLHDTHADMQSPTLREGHKVRFDPTMGEVFLDPKPEIRLVRNASDMAPILEEGLAQRRVAFTMMNHDSSRSHLFLVFNVTTVDKTTNIQKISKLSLIDLAGSERIKKSFSEGQQAMEAIQINKSLSALGDVFAALISGRKRSEVPYRNHKLTQMLQDSLGGTAKTIMFVCLRPDEKNIEETAMSLMFAERARNVINNRKVLKLDQRGLTAENGTKTSCVQAPMDLKVGKFTDGYLDEYHDAITKTRKSPRDAPQDPDNITGEQS